MINAIVTAAAIGKYKINAKINAIIVSPLIILDFHAYTEYRQ